VCSCQPVIEVRTTEGRFHSVGVEHLSARCDHLCDHSEIWNQMTIDKFTTDIKLQLVVKLLSYLLQYSIDYSKAVKTRVKTNEMPFLLVLLLTLSFTFNFPDFTFDGCKLGYVSQFRAYN